MKRLSAAVLALLVALSGTAFAASVSSPIYTTSASVDGSLEMDVVLRENDFAGAIVTDMAFGQLDDYFATGTLRSQGSVVAFITVNSHGLPYAVTQDGTTMSSGSDTLPSGACVVTPAYASQDNNGNGLPAGAVVGSGGTFVSTGKALYTSGAAGLLRTVQAHYSITDDTTAGSTDIVPLDQPGGSYAGTVVITVTA